MFNLRAWRLQNKTDEAERWMHENSLRGKDFFKLGTHPVLLLTGYNQWQAMPGKWGCLDLGWLPRLDESYDMRMCGLLHWNGPDKPWTDRGVYKYLWEEYFIDECKLVCGDQCDFVYSPYDDTTGRKPSKLQTHFQNQKKQ